MAARYGPKISLFFLWTSDEEGGCRWPALGCKQATMRVRMTPKEIDTVFKYLIKSDNGPRVDESRACPMCTCVLSRGGGALFVA